MRTFPLNLDAPAYLLLPGMVCAFDPINGGGDPDSDPEADDEDDDPDDEDDDEDKPKKKGKSEDDDEDDDKDDDFSDPVKARAIVAKARKEARKAKREAREASEAAKKSKSDGDPDKEKEAEDRGAKRGLDLAKKASVRAALLGSGLQVGDDQERAIKRAMRLIDLNDLEVDDDGTIDGLEDAIDELKDDYPAMFRRKKAPGRISGQDTGGTGRGRDKKLSASELQAQQLTGSK